MPIKKPMKVVAKNAMAAALLGGEKHREKSTTPVLAEKEKAGLAKIRLRPKTSNYSCCKMAVGKSHAVNCPLFPVVPPLTPAQTYLIEYGYTEEQARNFNQPDYVARSHGWNAGGEKSGMTNAEWSMRAKASVERDNEIARKAQAKRAAQEATVTAATEGKKTEPTAPKKEARMLYGHSYTACIRWMGLKGFTVEEVVKVLGADQVKEASIKNIMAGAVKLNGLTVATLTDAQGEELMTLAVKVVKKIPAKVSPKKTQGKK